MPIIIEPPFHHRDHVQLAWTVVRAEGLDEALTQVPAAIRAFAAAQGAAEKYHETLTRCWIRLVAAAAATTPVASFEGLVAAHPELLDKTLPHRFYSDARLGSDAARRGDVGPDLAPLPTGMASR